MEAGDTKPHVDITSTEHSGVNRIGDIAPYGYDKPRCEHVSFWDPSMVNVRLHVLKIWARTVLILMVLVFLVLALSNGVYSETPKRFPALNVYIVNFDGLLDPYRNENALIGPAVVDMAESIAKSPGPHLGFTVMDPSHFDSDAVKVRKAVFEFQAYAAVIVNANATALLRRAIESGNISYDPLGAGQALSPAIGFTTFDLRPFGPSEITPAVSIHLINLIIIAFFSFTFFFKTHMKFREPKGHPPLRFHHMTIWRWCATVAAYFLLSLAFSLVVLAYQAPISNSPASPTEPAANPTAYGRGTFVVYWMLNFIGMAALGLACENVAMALGEPWTAMWIIFWVTINVTSAFNNLDLAPGFYKWGYAFPLRNVVEASHQIFFDLHSRIGRNFGVLFAWAVVNTIVFPFTCYFMRWKEEREHKLRQEKEQKWLRAMAVPRTNFGIVKR